ncbi:MAG: hypothetical protein ACYCVB_04020 [Bacilli bacterium]
MRRLYPAVVVAVSGYALSLAFSRWSALLLADVVDSPGVSPWWHTIAIIIVGGMQ